MFTLQDEDFAYYLTDVSPDNIAVDPNNRIKFIDLENIIIVDKTTFPTGIFLRLKCMIF